MTMNRFLLSLAATGFAGLALTLAFLSPRSGDAGAALIVGAFLAAFASLMVTRAMVRFIREGRA